MIIAKERSLGDVATKKTRQMLIRRLTGQGELRLGRAALSASDLRPRLADLGSIGLYLHVPFCRQICPYCPYNKELFEPELADLYTEAVRREADAYADLLGGTPVTTLYIGGGTPTSMLQRGLPEVLEHARAVFNVRCDPHMESHPNDLSPANLLAIRALGVRHLSIGIESLSDPHLRALGRTYTAAQARKAMRRAVDAGFACVNVDIMFDLPGQTRRELEATARELVELGVHQVAAYPMFLFPHTRLGADSPPRNHGLVRSLRRRRMLDTLERVFYAAGFERTSVWAFTRRGVPRYCSVTVPRYIGLGAGSASYLDDLFTLNTFGASDYVKTIMDGRLPIALALPLSDRMQRVGWLYWRIYETRFSRTAYRERFGDELEATLGRTLRLFRGLGFLHDDGERIVLTDRGTFWLHAVEDLISIDGIGSVWGAAKREPWPDRVLV